MPNRLMKFVDRAEELARLDRLARRREAKFDPAVFVVTANDVLAGR
jgi:hypothetical protein